MLMAVQEAVEDEIQAYQYQYGREQPFAPLAEPTANGIDASAAAKHHDKRDAEQRISQQAAKSVSKTFDKHTARPVRVLGYIAHCSYIGSQRTRVQSHYEAEQEGCDYRETVVFQYILNKLHSTLKTFYAKVMQTSAM